MVAKDLPINNQSSKRDPYCQLKPSVDENVVKEHWSMYQMTR